MTSEQERDVRGIQRPNEWPAWPALPLKRYHKSGPMDAAFILDNAPINESRTRFPVKLYFGNMWRLNEPGYLETLKTIEYASAEAIIADGWEVD